MEIFKGTVTPKDWMTVGIMLAVIVVIAGVFFLFVHKEQLNRLAQLQKEDTNVKKELQEARTKQEGIGKLREETEKIKTLVEDFNKRLPTQREIPNLIRQFETMANDVGLSHSLKPEAPIRDENKETIPYSVSTWGDFHQTASFINRLERFERYLKVSDLKIEEEDEGVSKASFTLSTFRFIAPATPVATAAANTGGAS